MTSLGSGDSASLRVGRRKRRPPGAWLESRTGAGAAGRALLGAPARRGWWLGAAIAVAFGVQVATGMLLLVYYVPHPDLAFASANAILWDVPFGWLVRLAHAHGASALLALGITHTLVAALRADYKAPRELVWVTGRALLLLAFAAALSGYVLPWSQLSYWATTIATAPVEKVPLVGSELLRLARGGEAVGGATLSRAFVAHVALLPILAIAGFVLYGALLRRAARADVATRAHARAAPPGQRVLDVAIVALLYLAVLLALAAFAPGLAFPPHAHLPADPLETPTPIHPEWYFLWASELQRRIPDWIHLLPFASSGPLAPLAGWVSELLPLALIALAPLALLAVPFVDRSPERDPRRRPLALAVIAGTLLALALLTLAGTADAHAGSLPADGCVSCHAEDPDPALSDPVPEWRHSVHAEAEVGCDGCHGGNPHSDDEEEAHDEEAGWVGTPGWQEMAGFCGACHEAVAQSYEKGAFGAQFQGNAFPPTCATCHMATGHDTPRADPAKILPDPLPEKLRGVPALAGARDAVLPLAERFERTGERVAALARRALPPTDLDVVLARARDDWAKHFHRFETPVWAEGETRARDALLAIEARTGALEVAAGERVRLGFAGLGALAAVVALLAAARRAGPW